MLRYALKRIAIAVPMIIVASFAMFMMVAMSGDPMSRFRSMDPPPPQASLDQLERELGLDQPVLVRYWTWITGIVRGDFGSSVQNVDIATELGARTMVSFRLIVIAVVLAAAIAIVVGVISAMRQHRALDVTLSTIVFIALAIPVFWIGVLLKHAAIDVNAAAGTTLLFTVGDGASTGAQGLQLVGYLALPTVVLVINQFASWSRYVRSSMIEVLSADYMRLARAKGLTKGRAVIKHGLRNALMPFVTVIALDFSALVGGAIVTESIFQWRGMGDLLLNGIRNLDINVVMAWLLVFAVATILLNLLADLLYGVLDPRIRTA